MNQQLMNAMQDEIGNLNRQVAELQGKVMAADLFIVTVIDALPNRAEIATNLEDNVAQIRELAAPTNRFQTAAMERVTEYVRLLRLP